MEFDLLGIGLVTLLFLPNSRFSNIYSMPITTLFWKHKTHLVSQVHSWRGTAHKMNHTLTHI
jgi:hypothetical protein